MIRPYKQSNMQHNPKFSSENVSPSNGYCDIKKYLNLFERLNTFQDFRREIIKLILGGILKQNSD